MDRVELLNEIYAGRTRLEAALQKLTPPQMTSPDLPGGWSVKDLMAHLGWWENHVQELYRALVADGEPVEPINEGTVDAVNARVIETFRSRDLEDVRAYEQDAYTHLLELIETAPEADLFDPQRFSWTANQPFAGWLVGNSSGHYEEHLQNLENLLAKYRGAVQAPPHRSDLHPVVRRARQFLESQGRAVDRALFDFRFGAQPLSDALSALARYQNPDGGFSGLEVDIQAPQSNPFATELALSALVWLDPPRDHPIVTRLVEYLENTQDAEGQWRFDPAIYQYTLAPWFQGWQWPNLNPTCTTAGFLKQLGLGSDRLHERAQAAFQRLARPADLAGSDFYAARPYALYFQTEWNFPEADFYRWGAAWWMTRLALVPGDLDATHWMEYAPRPESALARRLPPDLLEAQLARLLAEQSDDGGWPTPYNPAWRPWVTVQNLMILRAYGKV